LSSSAPSIEGWSQSYRGLALLSGLLLGVSTPTLGLWPLIFIAFVPLLYAVEQAWIRQRLGAARAFQYGLLAGILYCIPNFAWLVNVKAWILPLVVLGYAMQFGVLATGIVFGLKAGLRDAPLSLWVACLWVSVEILASDVFAQVPSISTGLLLWKCPLLIQTADLAGAFAASFWIIAVNVLAARVLLNGWRACRTWGAVVIALTLAVLGYGYARLSAPHPASGTSSAEKPLAVTLVQSAVETAKKEERDTIHAVLNELVMRTIEATEARGTPTDLVVWPETSVPVYLRSLEEKDIVDELLRTARAAHAPILVGAYGLKKAGAGGNPETYNAVFLVPPKGYIAQEYRKVILVPFYERWPFYSRLPPWFRERIEGVQESPGEEPGLLELSDGRKFGTSICWETFYPGYVRQAARDGAQFLVSNTNDDAYYADLGHTDRIPLAQSIFRAVETRLYILRCTNMGVTMLISPRGEIVASLPLAKAGALSVQFVPSSGGSFMTRRGFVLAKGLFWATVVWAVLLGLRRHPGIRPSTTATPASI